MSDRTASAVLDERPLLAQTPMLLSGNHAVAWAARLARPQVVPVYPITPQTPILEKLTDFQAEGTFDAEILTPESEHSVLSACIPASLAGARVFTATASQGLLLMHELLHYASGARAAIVMANVNRTVASPWAFWPDQTDSLAQRDTGWIQFYSESAQESLDSVIQGFRIAEQVQLPVLVNHDAFYVSHALESVQVPSQALVDAYLPPYAPAHRLSTDEVESWGNVVSAEMFCRHRQTLEAAMTQALDAALAADREWSALTGRSHGLVERYRCDGARVVVVAIISIKLVASLDEAIAHVNRYGSHHTDAILTTNHANAMRFLREVDSASVMVNASTRFADGFEFGLGAEIGISTDKLHARGPVGLEGLTSLKWIVLGHGEVRT